MRLGRDLIFYADDVTEFTLPNGRAVRTNRWYYQTDLLDEGQEFYTAPKGLGIMSPRVDGFAMTADDGDGACYLRVLKSKTTILDPVLASTPVGQKAVRAGVFDEYWVCRQDAAASQ